MGTDTGNSSTNPTFRAPGLVGWICAIILIIFVVLLFVLYGKGRLNKVDGLIFGFLTVLAAIFWFFVFIGPFWPLKE